VARIAGPLFPEKLTPQAISAHKRSAAARIARHRRKWGLFSEVMETPRSTTLDEHRSNQRAAFEQRWREGRAKWARQWIEARNRLRSLPRQRALELLREWNGRTDGRRSPDDLLLFLTAREPPADLIEHRRLARLRNSASHIARARKSDSWYVAHVTCPEGQPGAVEIAPGGMRGLRCIACDASWRTKGVVSAAEAAGELRIVDCRRAEQLALAIE
jgi:hypothetical protein